MKDLSVIIPAYQIYPDLTKVQHALFGIDYEIIVEFDQAGEGKGAMLRRGLKKSSGKRVAWLDADMQINPLYIRLFLHNPADVIIGSKFLPDSEVKYPLKRRLLSTLSRWVLQVLFRFPFRDSQCGFKIFNRELLNHEWKVDGFGHDVEVLHTIAKKDGVTLEEVPVTIVSKGESSVSLKSCFKTLYEVLWLKIHLSR